VVFDVPRGPTLQSLELELSGSTPPSIGALYRGGGTYEVNCERRPWGQEKLSAAERRSCLAISRRFAAMQGQQAKRFKTLFPLAEAEPTAPSATARQWRATEQRLSCELEYPLGRLPRTGEIDVTRIGLRIANDTAAVEPEV